MKNKPNNGRLVKITKEQYNRIFAGKLINENIEEASIPQPVNIKGGGLDRVNKSFGQSLGNTKLSENTVNMGSEIDELIKYFYRKSETLSPFWGDNGISFDEICETLLDKNIIIKKDGIYELSKSLGSPENAKACLEKELNFLIGGEGKESMEEDYPLGAEYDSRAPWNQEDGEEEVVENDTIYDLIAYNADILILKHYKEPVFYVFDATDINTSEENYVIEYLNDWYLNSDTNDDEFIKQLDLNSIDDLEQMYSLNSHLKKVLLKIKDILSGQQNLGEGNEEYADTYKDQQPKLRTDAENKAILDKLKELKKREADREIARQADFKQDRQDKFGTGIDEMTATGSAGAFTAPMSAAPIKKKFSNEVPVVAEMTAGVGSVGVYDANALPGIKRDGSFKEAKKPKAFEKTQWSDGGFVELDDCTKLNNNKKAQNGGCSTGAVDNVVSVKKSKGNVNAPSLKEGMMREALKLQHDKEQNRLIVLSDLEGRAGSKETFTNKNVLKQNGFIWTGTNWAIPADKLDVAKNTLSLINKAEYIIDQLEDLELAVDDSAADNKSLLKARLDQYITDLANATDEKSLSAEIRRYLTFFSKFHSYSFHNRILIYIQRPEATKVASYKTWQSKFRQVNKGAKAITVLAPIIGKSDQDATDQDAASFEAGTEKKANEVRGYRAVNVFDIADTSPIDERGEIPDAPQWWGENTPSETADMLFNAVVEVASDLGVKVTQTDAKGGEKGFSAGDHINITSNVEGVGRLSTMIHEIGHELMHWKKSSIYHIDNGSGKDGYALGELQAESVSYVVLKHYDFQVTHHSTYLALWNANKEKIQNNLEIISKVSQFIITKIDEQIARGV